ncbi:MAG: aldehyde dehydrogenase family protein [Acidobacteriota bacterium]|nr:aldehyde dehydrogenase family protein [Acidobacteriota bacterium]
MATAAPNDRDRDLRSVQDARTLARRAKDSASRLAELSQAQIDAIVDAVAAAATAQAEPFARMAVDETGYGNVADKIQKNLFASDKIYRFIRPMKTVGIVARHDDRRVIEIAEPFGVVAAIVPSTNPTSTAIYKILIALKARCPVVISPHPSASRSITRVAEVLCEAACRAGAPEGSINWMTSVTLEGTGELMKAREVALILATGGMGLVRAAYSAGKPAYGVGPGNAPCFIERSANVAKAVDDIITGKTFDHGVLCSSPNSVVMEEAIAEEAKREFRARGGYFLSAAETDLLSRGLITAQRLPNPKLVGKTAMQVAAACGITAPEGTRVLIAELAGVGRDYPLSIEKLCPVLSSYVVRDWQEGCERSMQILRYGGMGHTMSIHSENEKVILEFGLRKPAFRISVNTPSTFGSIGLTTGLDPAMTLGCGGWGGNITSDNITPRHLLNIKRLAWEIAPASKGAAPRAGSPPEVSMAAAKSALGVGPAPVLPKTPARDEPAGITSAALSSRIDAFLASKGIEPPTPSTPATQPSRATQPSQPAPAEFVSEADVKEAIAQKRKIVLGEKTIVTPSARDLGEAAKVFVQASWKG